MNYHSIHREPFVSLTQYVESPVNPQIDLRPIVDPLISYVQKEILTGTAVWGLKTYAMKRPLTLTGRILGHGIPIASIAFIAYDVYQLADYIYSEY